MSSARPAASVVIDNYNYAAYLGAAIDSALAQTAPAVEVVVVDDGSTDHSRDVISRYEGRVVPVLKANGGQTSAFNAGYAASRGEVVIFLDSDDLLLPHAVEKALALFAAGGVSKVHWLSWVCDREGRPTGTLLREKLSEGDMTREVLRAGSDGYDWPPTSSNAWSRAFLDQIFPLPAELGHLPELLLETLAPLYGAVRAIQEPQGCWRHHGENHSGGRSFESKLTEGVGCAECCLDALEEHARRRGLVADPAELRRNSRWHQMKAAADAIESMVPSGATFILVDQDQWATGETILGRRRFLFPEENGRFWGIPADDAMAIRELERLRGEGAAFIVFVWPYLWWLDHYLGFASHLREHFAPLLENDRLVIFDLR